jgi:hypothetical protein
MLDRGKAKAAPMNMADSAAGKEEGKALKGKEKAPRPHPLLYVVLWVSASARRPLLGLPSGHVLRGPRPYIPFWRGPQVACMVPSSLLVNFLPG